MLTSFSVSLFFSGDRKHDSATTTAHNKRLIALLKEKSINVIIKYNMVNTDGCAE